VKFAGKALAEGGEIVHDALAQMTTRAHGRGPGGMAASKKKCLRCDDCYFKQNMLCALKLDAPCPTFRPAERGLAPERQLAFVFRTERTRAAYAFPQAQSRW
jgi:hypothetical protein